MNKAFVTGMLVDYAPSWSLDGKHIVFRVCGKNERGLRILDLDSGNVTVLTSERDKFPFYAPKGDRICFTRDVGEDEYDGSPQPYAELFVMRADGFGQTAITNDKWEEGTPA